VRILGGLGLAGLALAGLILAGLTVARLTGITSLAPWGVAAVFSDRPDLIQPVARAAAV